MQRYINIAPVSFAAPNGGVKSNMGRQIRRFSIYTSSYLRNGAR